MCLTTPVQIIKIKNNELTVKNGKKIYQVKNLLLAKVKTGDWLLTNANLALSKITAKEAKEILKILNQHEKI
ncbi:MAG: HypC/HybG/HupF family hydrogenase formation chaperone [Candidatus Buchananbacteria bacterium]